MSERSRVIAEDDKFARLLGSLWENLAEDRVEVRLPSRPALVFGQVHRGATSDLVDIVSTAMFWSEPDLSFEAHGTSVGFDIDYLRLAAKEILLGQARVRRRSGGLCKGDLTVRSLHGSNAAIATVIYKLSGGSGAT